MFSSVRFMHGICIIYTKLGIGYTWLTVFRLTWLPRKSKDGEKWLLFSKKK